MSSVECLREFVNERLSAAAEEIFGVFKRTVVEYQEEIDRQRRMLDVFWKPDVKLHRIKLPQPRVCTEEEVLCDQQLCLQERNPSVDQEDPDPPQIKEEQEELCSSQEGEQLEPKQETFMLTPTCEERDHGEDQLLDLCTDETQTVVQETSLGYISVESATVVEPSNDHQLLSHNSHESDGKDQKRVKRSLTSSKEQTPPGEKPFSCKTCGKTFECSSGLKAHMEIHTKERPYSCNTCGKTFTRTSHLKRHTRIHTGERPHVKDQKRVECSLTSSKEKTPPGEKPFMCKRCGKYFKHKNGLLSHVKRAHSVDQPYVCNTCGKRFIHESACKNHKRVHSDEKAFSCKTCGKTFKFSSSIKLHTEIHSGERPYSCITCGKTFNHAASLKLHTSIHTGEKPYSCNTCGKTFRDKSHLKLHTRIHTGEKPYSCNTCGKTFTHAPSLKLHTRVHTGEKPYSCNTCGKTFTQSSHLKSHTPTHSNEKPYSCKMCKRDFRSSNSLYAHMRRTHKGKTS